MAVLEAGDPPYEIKVLSARVQELGSPPNPRTAAPTTLLRTPFRGYDFPIDGIDVTGHEVRKRQRPGVLKPDDGQG